MKKEWYSVETFLNDTLLFCPKYEEKKNAIKEYPYSKYKEELEMLVLKSRYREASESVDEKKEERFRTVIDEYYSFINDYPDSDHRKEADNIFKVANKFVNGN